MRLLLSLSLLVSTATAEPGIYARRVSEFWEWFGPFGAEYKKQLAGGKEPRTRIVQRFRLITTVLVVNGRAVKPRHHNEKREPSGSLCKRYKTAIRWRRRFGRRFFPDWT